MKMKLSLRLFGPAAMAATATEIIRRSPTPWKRSRNRGLRWVSAPCRQAARSATTRSDIWVMVAPMSACTARSASPARAALRTLAVSGSDVATESMRTPTNARASPVRRAMASAVLCSCVPASQITTLSPRKIARLVQTE